MHHLMVEGVMRKSSQRFSRSDICGHLLIAFSGTMVVVLYCVMRREEEAGKEGIAWFVFVIVPSPLRHVRD